MLQQIVLESQLTARLHLLIAVQMLVFLMTWMEDANLAQLQVCIASKYNCIAYAIQQLCYL